MLKFFRTIPYESRINRIFGFTRIFLGTINACPVRDNIWVETMESPKTHRAVRYGIYRNRACGNQSYSVPTARGSLLAFRFLPICSPYGTYAKALRKRRVCAIFNLKNMLKFFRTIRKKLIEQDNVRKYLIYAIGEILLVVIGKLCPVRDYLSVETMRSTTNQLCR